MSCASGLYIWQFYSCFNILDNAISKICNFFIFCWIGNNTNIGIQIWFNTFRMFLLTPHWQLALGVHLHAYFFDFRKLVPQVEPRGGQAHETVWQPLVYDIKWMLNTYVTYLLWTQVEVIVSGFGRGVNSSFSCQWRNSVHIRKKNNFLSFFPSLSLGTRKQWRPL